MNNSNELDQLVESFLSPAPVKESMGLKELFALFEEVINEAAFTGLQLGTEKPLRGKEEQYKTDFFSLMQAALGEKIVGASNASDAILQIITQIDELKNQENWKNYKLSQAISVITFVESLYEMIYNIQGDNPDVAGKMFERFIAFATKGRVSSQIALTDTDLATKTGASSTSIFDLITPNGEFVSVKLIKEFKVTGSINNLYKYLFNVDEDYKPIDINELQNKKTDKKITYLVTVKGQDKEQLIFYAFTITCDNFINVIGEKRIDAYNKGFTFDKDLKNFESTRDTLDNDIKELLNALAGTRRGTGAYYALQVKISEKRKELNDVNTDINNLYKTKGKRSTSFSVSSLDEAGKYKTNLWGSVLKVEAGEKDAIVTNSTTVFNGKMKGLIEEASAVYYKVSNLLLKLEDEKVSLEEKVSTGKEAHNSIKTLEDYLLSVTKEYNIALKDKKQPSASPEQTKLF